MHGWTFHTHNMWSSAHCRARAMSVVRLVVILYFCACFRFWVRLAQTSQRMLRTVTLMSLALQLVALPQPCARSQRLVRRWVSVNVANM